MNPPSCDPSPPQRLKNKARRLINPYLHHQVPSILNAVTPTSPKTFYAEEEEMLDSFREVPDSATRSRKGSEAIAKRIAENLSPVQEELQTSKNIRLRVAHLLQRQPERVSSNIVNGNVVENLPKMKPKTLKDRLILLKKVARQMENCQKPNATEGSEQQGLKGRRLKAMSSVPDLLDNQKSGSSDFTEVLKGFLFRKKKKSLVLLTDRSESRVEPSPLLTCASPEISSKHAINTINIADVISSGRKKKNRRKSSDRESPNILTQRRGSKPTKSYNNSQKLESPNLHKRVNSVALPSLTTDEIKLEGTSKILLKGDVKTMIGTQESDYVYSLEELKLPVEEALMTDQTNKQAVEFERNVVSRGSLLSIRPLKGRMEQICLTDRPRKREKSQPSWIQKKNEDQRAAEIDNFRISIFKKLQCNLARSKQFERQNRMAF